MAQLYTDLAKLSPSAYRSRCKVLRCIAKLFSLVKKHTKAAEATRLADREAYYSCAAMALAKAEDTLDPRDVLLATTLVADLDPSHILVYWASAVVFASEC